jgi:hypothetical protein
VFADPTSALAETRRRLAWYPDGVWWWLLACQWRRLDLEEPLVQRTAEVADDLGSAVVTAGWSATRCGWRCWWRADTRRTRSGWVRRSGGSTTPTGLDRHLATRCAPPTRPAGSSRSAAPTGARRDGTPHCRVRQRSTRRCGRSTTDRRWCSARAGSSTDCLARVTDERLRRAAALRLGRPAVGQRRPADPAGARRDLPAFYETAAPVTPAAPVKDLRMPTPPD